MTKYYHCHTCAHNKGDFDGLVDVANLDLTGSSYQLSKYFKHTDHASSDEHDVVSVFNDADYNKYAEYTVNTACSGSVEFDGLRKNIVWLAGDDPIGVTYTANGTFETNAVKIVLYEDKEKVHIFNTGSTELIGVKCKICGTPIYK